MTEKQRCQSCGMPLGSPGFYGTNADGSDTHDYCKFCFQNGAFTQPNIDVESMIKSSATFMSQNLGFTYSDAEQMSRGVIPELSRWKKDN